MSFRLRFLSICALLITCFSPVLHANQLIVEDDTTVCPGTAVTFHGIGSTPISLLVDDYHSGRIPIGFTFNFYGANFNDCVISSNGYITFDTTKANTFSAWAIATGIPGNSNCYNSILGHYADIYPALGGIIDYVTVGNSPNRMFVVTFCSVPMFGCTTINTTFQMVLHETTNLIDIHLKDKPLCTTWNSGAGIEGVQNYNGTQGTAVPGRNFPGTWTATNSSHQFTPVGSTSYSVLPIPFAPIATSGSNFAWFANAPTGVPIATTQNVTVTPTVTTKYYIREIHCQDTTYDSVSVIMGLGGTISSTAKTDPSICGSSNGSITLNGMTPNTVYTVHYSKNGTPQPAFSATASSTGSVFITGLGAGTYTGIYMVSPSGCPTNTVGPITLNNPPLTADFNYSIRYGCSSDTVLFVNLSQTPGALLYYWRFGDNLSDTAKNPKHVYYSQKTYNVTLLATNGSCNDSVTKSVDLAHPLDASFTVDDDSVCQQQTLQFTNTSITTTKNNIAPQYFWDFGDGGTSTQQNPTYTYTRSGIYRARLVVKDFVPCFDTFYHTIVVDSIPFVTFATSDSVLCEGQGTVFTANYLMIGNTGITWDFGDGAVFPNLNPISHAYDSSGVFTIKLTSHYRLCPDTSFTRQVNVHPFPGVNLGPDTALCPNGNPIALVELTNAGNPAATYLWNTGATTPYILANAPGTYWAQVTVGGCSATDSILVNKDCYLDVPNSFTPNGDGMNDYFLPRQLLSRSVNSFHMQVFNRWGQIIFETTRLDGRGWDGTFNDKAQPQGVYVYLIDAMFENGVKEHYTGNVTLLR